MRLSVDKIARFSGAHLLNSACDLEKRSMRYYLGFARSEPGFVYVALPGERVDGHDFVESACKSGAAAVLVMKDLPEEAIACAEESATAILRVSSTHEAFTPTCQRISWPS